IAGLFSGESAVIDAASGALSTMRWGLVGFGVAQVMMEICTVTGEIVSASVLMILADISGVVVAWLWPAPPIDAAAAGFVTQCLGNAVLLPLLLRRALGR